ncbi:tripartite tricarboxylate transporter substrate binding protein [Roseibium sp. SCP14]|uniref:tripartite tricarboxylate transporter substrate binding protein n=1 Tax=Roseibium sp. SCP14 TaxID=3141375 RepID=UPI0033374F51
MKLKSMIAGAVAGAFIALGSAAQASDWKPSGTLKLQIGFGAGGATDTMGRVIAKVMKEQTGWNIIAENKTGGGGVAMFTGISKMPPKGNVIGMGVNMPIIVNLVNRGDQLPFNLDSFDYLGTVAQAQLALVALADAPFDTLPEMIEYAKANEGMPVAFDAPPQKLMMEFVDGQAEAGFRLVSTKGAAESEKLILGGQVLAGFSAGSHKKYLESGDMKMIASANEGRHNYAPDVETFREAGYDIYVDPYFFFATGAGTEPEAREALVSALANAIASEEVAEVVRNVVTSNPVNLGPDATKKMMEYGVLNGKVLFGK